MPCVPCAWCLLRGRKVPGCLWACCCRCRVEGTVAIPPLREPTQCGACGATSGEQLCPLPPRPGPAPGRGWRRTRGSRCGRGARACWHSGACPHSVLPSSGMGWGCPSRRPWPHSWNCCMVCGDGSFVVGLLLRVPVHFCEFWGTAEPGEPLAWGSAAVRGRCASAEGVAVTWGSRSEMAWCCGQWLPAQLGQLSSWSAVSEPALSSGVSVTVSKLLFFLEPQSSHL